MKTHMQIRAVGKPQESWMREVLKMYAERLSAFGKLEILEVAEGHDGSAKPDIRKTKQSEALGLTKNLSQGSYLVALDETGQQYASPKFAELLERQAADGRTVVFLIGGSWGLDESVLKQADLVLSLGKLTLPHSLARIVLLEQIYRAHMISAGREYHK
jgi:23S rRNA (pseudouridine1915-N3)-methyltransferase